MSSAVLSLEAIIAASWANTALYAVQLVVSVWYLCTYASLQIYRWGICVALVVDGATTITVFANTWLILMVFTQPPPVLDIQPPLDLPPPPAMKSPWTLPTQIILTSFSVFLEHAFFGYRYWSISRDAIGTCIIVLLIIGHEGSALAAGLYSFIYPASPDDLNPFRLLVTASACAAGADIVISGALVYRLKHLTPLYAETKSLLHRVAVASLSCGITAVVAASLIIVFIFLQPEASYVMFAILGRVYSLTVIVNLVILKSSNNTKSRTQFSSGSGPVVLTPLYFDNSSQPGSAKRSTMPIGQYPRPSKPSITQDAPAYPLSTLRSQQDQEEDVVA